MFKTKSILALKSDMALDVFNKTVNKLKKINEAADKIRAKKKELKKVIENDSEEKIKAIKNKTLSDITKIEQDEIDLNLMKSQNQRIIDKIERFFE